MKTYRIKIRPYAGDTTYYVEKTDETGTTVYSFYQKYRTRKTPSGIKEKYPFNSPKAEFDAFVKQLQQKGYEEIVPDSIKAVRFAFENGENPAQSIENIMNNLPIK